jgi:hypothetical protein
MHTLEDFLFPILVMRVLTVDSQDNGVQVRFRTKLHVSIQAREDNHYLIEFRSDPDPGVAGVVCALGQPRRLGDERG